MDASLGRFPVTVDIAVAWGEMDAFQHVNNTVYVRWLETARIAYFERLGLIERMKRDGIGPILARTTIDYKKPLAYPDRVSVDVTVSRVGGSSFTMAYRVRSHALGGAEAASAETVIVVYDYTNGRSAPCDDELRAAIRGLEASTG